MKIGFVLNRINGGGIGRVVSTYANLIADNTEHEVHLILLHKKDHLYKLSPKIKVIENDSNRASLNKFSYTLDTYKFLRKNFSRNVYDRLIVSGEWINSFAYFATIFTQQKNIYFFDHSNPLRDGQSPFLFADKIAYQKVEGVLVLSEAARLKVLKKFPNVSNTVIVENPVLFLDKNEKIESKNIIISMGRLSSEKGQDILIKAFAKSDNKDWELHFLGDGPLKAELIELAEKLNITEKVVFLGNQKNIADFLSTAKIYVMPSKTENFPMALLEVMSLGLPCIVTDCMPWRGDEDFIINNANGIKVPVDGVDEMAMALSRLINNDEERSFFSKKSLEIRERLNLNKTLEAFSKAIKI